MIKYTNANIPAALLPGSLSSGASGNMESFNPAVLCDIEVEGSFIKSVGNAEGEVSNGVDLKGQMVFPGFVDVHTHLDKAHTWTRSPSRSCEFDEAISIFEEEKELWNEQDIYRRADFSLRCASAYGTVALRTHLDSSQKMVEMVYPVINQLKAEWANRIQIQSVPMTSVEGYSTSAGERMARRIAELGGECLGGMPVMNPDLDAQLDRLFSIASELGLSVDLHVDENGDSSTECLRHTAEAVLRNRFPFPVVCGHCCSLALQQPEKQASTLDLIKEAGISIVSLPLCNQFLQGRVKNPLGKGCGTPFWRGITLYHEMLEMGIPLACASDNVRDAFYAFGDHDMLEVYVQSVRMGQLETRLDITPRLVTQTPAAMMGLEDRGKIAPGMRADMVVFPARNFSELLSRPATSRRLISGESFREVALPDYSELD